MIRRIDFWLARDKQENVALYSNQQMAQCPTRLVEILGHQGSRLRVVHTRDWATVPAYVALSHRWPTVEACKLLTANSPQLHETGGLLITSLNPSCRDAVQLAFELGFVYMWIDLFCILQDDHKDWSFEASGMPEVYENAQLTIALDLDPDMSHSPLQSLMDDVAHRLSNGRPNFYRELSEINYDDDVVKELLSAGLLATRGWCFQERLLSKRILHIFSSKLVWERVIPDAQQRYFSTLQVLVNEEWSPPVLDFRSGGRSLLDFVLGRIRYPESESRRRHATWSDELFREWIDCVEEYSRRGLTKKIDRLIAIAVIVHKFEVFTDDQCVCGCFSKPLLRCLLWYKPELLSVRRLTHLGAKGEPIPTWSWAAVEGAIRYRVVLATPPWNDYYGLFDSLRIRAEVAVVSFGQLLKPEMVLGGSIQAVQVYCFLVQCKQQQDTGTWSLTDDRAFRNMFGIDRELPKWTSNEPEFQDRIECRLDVLLSDQEENGRLEYFFLPLLVNRLVEHEEITNDEPGRYTCEGLLIAKQPGMEGIYQRRGWMLYCGLFRVRMNEQSIAEAMLRFGERLKLRQVEEGVAIRLV